jgi:hypothetical protein
VGALWLPKNTILRSVSLYDETPLTIFGAVGEGITLVQQPSSVALASDMPKAFCSPPAGQ